MTGTLSYGLAFDSMGNLFETCGGTSGFIEEYTPTGSSSRFATIGGTGFLVFDSAGNLYDTDGAPTQILKYSPSGTPDGIRSHGRE